MISESCDCVCEKIDDYEKAITRPRQSNVDTVVYCHSAAELVLSSTYTCDQYASKCIGLNMLMRFAHTKEALRKCSYILKFLRD